jgi:hypothetical protein
MSKPYRLFLCLSFLVAAGGLAGAQTATNTPVGLWAGEVTLQAVNETVSGVNAANQVVSPDPSVTTPVHAPAHMRIILHVDTNGVVRLLKGVAMVATTPTNVVLLTDPTLYSQYGSLPGQRLTAVAFDFGDGPAAQNALTAVATAAATAAASGTDPLAAANAAVYAFQTNIPPGSTANYSNFVQSSTFTTAASEAATSAAQGLVGVDPSTATSRKIQLATLAAINDLTTANAYLAADSLILNEMVMHGQFGPGNILTANIYLGADHPTNPFRHKWNPIEQHGYGITRSLTITFDSAASTNATAMMGFGVDHISGTYHESILGLHKPLGPNQNIGLLTDGIIKLDRVSPIGWLNQ